MTTGFTNVLLLYPILSRLSYTMAAELFFPEGDKSFHFVLVMWASEVLQDLVCQNVCAIVTHHRPLEHPFRKENRMLFLAQWAVSLFSCALLTNLGWYFKTALLGPWAPRGD